MAIASSPRRNASTGPALNQGREAFETVGTTTGDKASLGDRQSTLKSSAILALCITVPGCLLFSYVLQLPFPLFRLGF